MPTDALQDFNEPRSLVVSLFEQLHALNIQYAVLRNYEDFPNFQHDIDLVVRSSDLGPFKNALKTIALSHGWTVTQCEHYAQSSFRHFNIEVFQLYRTESAVSFLQIDIFHGFINWSTPLFTEKQLLEDPLLHPRFKIYTIDPKKENLYRLLQIYSLLSHNNSQEKIYRYRQRVLKYWIEQGKDFSTFMKLQFSFDPNNLFTALKASDWAAFKKIVFRFKCRLFLNFFLKNPWLTVKMIAARVLDYSRLFLTNPCGRTLKIHLDDHQINLLILALDQLKALNVIRSYELPFLKRSNLYQKRRCLEQGGLVILRVNRPKQADTLRLASMNAKEIQNNLLTQLIHRHKVL